MDIAQFIKVTCKGRKIAVYCDENSYDEFFKNVSERFNIPEDDLELITSDNTEIDRLFFKTVIKCGETLYARDRTACQSQESTEISTGTFSPLQSPTSSSKSSSSISPSQPTIKIPWNKVPTSIIKTFEDEEILTKKQRCLLINVLWEEINQNNNRTSRKTLREVAGRAVRRYPRSFEKRIDGMLISDGIEELMLSLESKRDNGNRPDSSEKPKKAGLDIKSPPGSGELNETELKDLFLMDELSDVQKKKVAEAMIRTYDDQRTDLTAKDTSINMVKAKWPFLYKTEHFLKHFELQTNTDLMKLFSSIGQIQSTRVYDFLKDQNGYNLSELQDLQSKPDVTWSYIMLVMIFKEDLKELIVCQDSLKTEKLPCTPCIVAIGPSIFHASKYCLIVDKEPVNTDIANFSVAMAMQFAAFFIFNIRFPKKVMNTLEAFQRFILKFRYDDSVTDIPKCKKKKITVNEQVLKFAEELAKHEAYLECDPSI